ncbi:MAG: FlgD immunoglobulin-like domain containing protein [Rickettsiaceae bacterium]|nr:FlgD immunoglobulin-like domain containing protein [Rickettsiaceae bacterium]
MADFNHRILQSQQQRGASAKVKILTPEESSKSEKIDYLKIIAAMMKNPNPEKPIDMGATAQIIAATKTADQIEKLSEKISDLCKNINSNQKFEALSLVGKNVQYDTSKKYFDGKNPIDFKYKLDVNSNIKNLDATLISNISVFNQNGVRVARSEGKREKGSHIFKWDGKDQNGKLLAKGQYRIEAEAFLTKWQSGEEVKIPVESGGYELGQVESLVTENGTTKLLINNELVDLENIIKITPIKEKDSKPTLLDYAQYLNKIAEIDDTFVSIDQTGNGEVKFSCDIEQPKEGIIKFYNENDLVIGIANLSKITNGQNSLKFAAKELTSEQDIDNVLIDDSSLNKLDPGHYKYKIFVQDSASRNPLRYNPISTARSVKITGLDFEQEPQIISGSERFDIKNVKKLLTEEESSLDSALAAGFIGKSARVQLEEIKSTGTTSQEAGQKKIKITEIVRDGNSFKFKGYILDTSGQEILEELISFSEKQIISIA